LIGEPLVQIGGLAWWTRICGDFATKISESITNYMLSNFQGPELNRGLGKMGYVFFPCSTGPLQIWERHRWETRKLEPGVEMSPFLKGED